MFDVFGFSIPLLGKAILALASVLGLIAALAWIFKKFNTSTHKDPLTHYMGMLDSKRRIFTLCIPTESGAKHTFLYVTSPYGDTCVPIPSPTLSKNEEGAS